MPEFFKKAKPVFARGLEKQCIEEMTGYFKYMADRTGTLWEHDSDGCSCNHGFASYAAVLIDRCLSKTER